MSDEKLVAADGTAVGTGERGSGGAPGTGPVRALQWISVAWALAAVAASAQVHPHFLLVIVLGLTGLVLALWWCAEAVRKLGLRPAVAWALCPAVGVISGGVSLTDYPLKVRVVLHERDLAKLAWAVRNGTPEVTFPRRVGTFVFEAGAVNDGCVYLHTGAGFLFSRVGLVYCPGELVPTRLGPPTRTHYLVGRWWTFETHE